VSVSEPPEHGPGDDKVTSGAGHLSREDVAHLAHLARLEVTDDELDRYAGQLDVILTSVAVVSEVVAGGGVATKWQPPGSGDPSERSGTVSEVVAGGGVATKWQPSRSGDPSEQSGTVSEVVAGGGVATKWQPPGSGDPSEQSGTVSRVASDDIEPTSHAVPLVNVFREDVPQPGLTRDQALAMAPSAEAGRFRVPQILGEEQ